MFIGIGIAAAIVIQIVFHILLSVGIAIQEKVRNGSWEHSCLLAAKKMRFLAAKLNTLDLEFIIKLVEEGKVKPVIDGYYPLHETAEAVRYLSHGHAQGKVLIEIVRGTV